MDNACAETINEAVERDPNVCFNFHHLCEKCAIAIHKSEIIPKIDGAVHDWSTIKGYVHDTDQDLQETVLHHASIDDLQKSAAYGCHLCTIISDGLDASALRNIPTKYDSPKHSEVDRRGDKSQEQLYLRITLPLHRGKNSYYTRKQSYIQLGQYDANSGQLKFPHKSLQIDRAQVFQDRTHQRMGPQRSLHTGSDATLDLAKEWLRSCIKGHKECNSAYNSAAAMPSRLLQVDILSDGLCIKLCDHEDIRKKIENDRIPYITLSHRWPKEPIVCLTKANEDLLRRGIPVNSIPKNFEDAAQITRRLGYEYLWIDSLCIFQDSPLDWEHESAIMGDVYRGSVLTIASLSSGGDSAKGIFTTRNPLKYIPCALLRHHLNTGLAPTRIPYSYFAIGPNFTGNQRYPEGGLLSRGWVVQERVLAPRTLYFETRGILWECADCYATPELPEMTYNGSMQDSYSPKQAFSLLRLDSPPDLNKPTEKFLSFHTSWSRLVGNYTQCHLTMDSDKLVAINGMMRKIQASTGMRAVAGLFMDILPAELLWFPIQNAAVLAPLAGPYRAPSWSWASLDVPVKNNYVDLVRKLDFSFDWKLQLVSYQFNDKPNGQLASAHVLVEAVLRKIKWPSHTERTRQIHRSSPNQKTLWQIKHHDHWVADHADAYDGDIWALHIAHGTGAFFIARDPEFSVYEDGLCDVGILVKKVGDEGAVFRRVGYFEQHYWALDKHPVFVPGIAVETQRITIV